MKVGCIIRELSQGDFKLCAKDMALMDDMLAPFSATFVQDIATHVHDTKLDSGRLTTSYTIESYLSGGLEENLLKAHLWERVRVILSLLSADLSKCRQVHYICSIAYKYCQALSTYTHCLIVSILNICNDGILFYSFYSCHFKSVNYVRIHYIFSRAVVAELGVHKLWTCTQN